VLVILHIVIVIENPFVHWNLKYSDYKSLGFSIISVHLDDMDYNTSGLIIIIIIIIFIIPLVSSRTIQLQPMISSLFVLRHYLLSIIINHYQSLSLSSYSLSSSSSSSYHYHHINHHHHTQ